DVQAAQAIAATTMSATVATAGVPVGEPITANEAQGPLDAAILLPCTALPEGVATGASNSEVTAAAAEEQHRHVRAAVAPSQCRSALQLLAGDLAVRLRAAAVPSDCCYCCYSHGGGDGKHGATGLEALADPRGQAVSPSELSSLRVQVEAVALLVSAVPYIVTAAAATTGSSAVVEEVDGCNSTVASAAATLRQLSEALLAAVSSGRCRRHHATQPCVLAAPLAHLAEALSGWTAAVVTGGDGAASAAAAAELATRLSHCGTWLLSYSRQSVQNMAGAMALSLPPPSAETTLNDAAVTDEATGAGGCNHATAAEATAVMATVKATVAIDNISPPLQPAASAARRPPTRRSSPGHTCSGQRDRALQRATSDAGSANAAAAAAATPAKCLKLASTRTPPSLGDALEAETAAASLTITSRVLSNSSSHSGGGGGGGTNGTACSSDGIVRGHFHTAEVDDYAAAALIEVAASLPCPPQSMLKPKLVEDRPANVLKTVEEESHAEAIVVQHVLPVPPPLAAAVVSYPAQPQEVLSVETKPVAAGDLLSCTATAIAPLDKPLPPTPPDDVLTRTSSPELQDVVREQVKQQLQPPTQRPQPEHGPPRQLQMEMENLNRLDVASFSHGSETTYQEISPQLDRAAALLRTAQAQIPPPLPNKTVVLLAALPGPFFSRAAVPLVPTAAAAAAAAAVTPGDLTEHIDQMLCQVIALIGSEGNMRACAVPEREDILKEAAATLAARSQLLRGVLALAITDSHAASAAVAEAETLLRARLSSGDNRRREYQMGLLVEAIALQGAVREVRGQLYGATRLYDEALEMCRAEVLGPAPHADILLLRAALTAAHGRCAVRLAALIPYAISDAKPFSRPKPAPTDPWATPCPIPWYVLEYPSRRSTRDSGICDGSGAAEDQESSAPGKEKDVVASATSSVDRDPRGRQQRMMPLPSLAPRPCPRVVMAAAKAVPRVAAEFRTVCEALANSQGSAGAGSDGGPAATAVAPPLPQLMALAEVAVVLVRLQLLAAAEPSLLQTDGGTGYNYQGRCLREAMMLACAMMRWLPLTGARAGDGGSGTGSDAASSWTAAGPPSGAAAAAPNLHRPVPRHAESALLAAVCATALTLVYGSPLAPSHAATTVTAAAASTMGSSTSSSSTGPIAAVLATITQSRQSPAPDVTLPAAETPANVGATDNPWDRVWDWGKIALNARQELYGVDSEPALDAQAFLAYVAGAGLGLWHVAEPLLVSLLALRGEKLGPAHRATQATATYYLDLLLRNNRFRTAENVLRRLLPRALTHQRQLQQKPQQMASGSANAAAVAASGSSPSVSAPTAHRSGGATKESKRPRTAMSSMTPSSPLPLLKLQHRLEELKRVATPISASAAAVARQPPPGTAAAARGETVGSALDGELPTPMQTATTQPQVLAAAAAVAIPEATLADLLYGRTPTTCLAAVTPPAAAASLADATAAIIATPAATVPLLSAEATAAASREKPIKGTSAVAVAAEPAPAAAAAAACSRSPEPTTVALSHPAIATTTAAVSSDDSGEAGSCGGPGHSILMQQQRVKASQVPMSVFVSTHADLAPKATAAQVAAAVTVDALVGAESMVSVAEKLNVAAETMLTQPKAAAMTATATAAMERSNLAAAAAKVTAPPGAPPKVAVTAGTQMAAAGQPKGAAAVVTASEERLPEATSVSEIAPKAVAAAVATSILPLQRWQTRPNTALRSAINDEATATIKLQQCKPQSQQQQQQPAAPSRGLFGAISLRNAARPARSDQAAAAQVEMGMPAPPAAVVPDGRTRTHLLAFRRAAAALRRSAEAMDDAGAPVLGGTHSGSSGGGGGDKAAVAITYAAKEALVVTEATAASEAAAAQVAAVAGSCRQIHDQPSAPDVAPTVAVLSPLKRTSLKAVAAAYKAGLAASPTSTVAPTSSRTRSPSIKAVASSSVVHIKVCENSEPAIARAVRTVPEVLEQMEFGLTGVVANTVAAAAQTLSAAVKLESGSAARAYASVRGEMAAQIDVSGGGFPEESGAARGAEAAAQLKTVKAEVAERVELHAEPEVMTAVKMDAELGLEAKVEEAGKPVEKDAALAKAGAEAVKKEAMVQAATWPEANVAAAAAVKMDTTETSRSATTGAMATSRLSTTSATAAAPRVTEIRSAATSASASSASLHGVALDRPPQYQSSKEPSPPLTCRSSLPPRRRLELAFELESDEFRGGLGLVRPAQQPLQPPPQRLPQLPQPQSQSEDEGETRSQSPKPQQGTRGFQASVCNECGGPAAVALLPGAIELVADEIAAIAPGQPKLESRLGIPQASQEPEARTDIVSESRPRPQANVNAAPGEMATVLQHEQLAREPAVASEEAATPCAARSKSHVFAVQNSAEYDADGSESAVITVQVPTVYDPDVELAERSTRGSVSPADGSGSAVITVQVPTVYDPDVELAERSTRGSVSPADGSGSAVITVQVPTVYDPDVELAERWTRGSGSPADGSESACITVRGPTVYDPDVELAERSTRGSGSPADGSGSAVITVQVPTVYDPDVELAERSTRGSGSPADGSESACITVRGPTVNDPDVELAERSTRGSGSPADGSGSAVITVQVPTVYDPDVELAERSTRGSGSPADGSESACITVRGPTVYDPDVELAERSTRGSGSPAEAPARSGSPVVTIPILEGGETDGNMMKRATPGSVSRAGSESPIATVVTGDDAEVRWTHGSASSGELQSCRSRTATPNLPPPPAAYGMEMNGWRQSRPVGVLELVAVPQMTQSAAVGFEGGMRLAQASMPAALEPPPSPTAIAETKPPQAASSATRQLDAAVESAPPLQQSLVRPLHNDPPPKERRQQQQLPAPSLAASISALLAAVTPLASPAPMGSPSGCRTSPPSPMPFHIGLMSDDFAVTSAAAPPRADVVIDIGCNPAGSEVALMKCVVQYYEETEDTEEEDGGPMQPLQPPESLHPSSLLDPLTSSLSPQSSTAITEAAASPLPTRESPLALDNLPSPLQPRPSSMDYSAPVPLQPLPLEPLPYMQDPLPSMQPPLPAVPGTLAADSPALSWTSVGAAVPPVGAPEEINAGVRLCPDTDISLIHLRSVRGYGLRKLEVGRCTVSARDGGDRTCYSYSSSPLATAESPLSTAAMMAAETSAAGPGRRAAGNIATVGREEGVQPSWKGSESLQQHVVGMGLVPRPFDVHRLKRLPPPKQMEATGWRPGVKQPAVATAAALDAPVPAAAGLHQQRFRSAGSCSLSTTSTAGVGVGFPLCNALVDVTRRRTAEPFEVEFDGSGGTAGQQKQQLQPTPDPAVSERSFEMGEGSASVGTASLGTHSMRWERLEEVEEVWRGGAEGWFGRSARERELGRRVDVVD
ncbi:hypothetical protein VaNZ11_003421, partial [Volvox africanus]